MMRKFKYGQKIGLRSKETEDNCIYPHSLRKQMKRLRKLYGLVLSN